MWDSAGADICEHATFVSVKGHLKVIVRLKFQKFKYEKLYKPSHIVHFWICAMQGNICVAVPQNHVQWNDLELALSTWIV